MEFPIRFWTINHSPNIYKVKTHWTHTEERVSNSLKINELINSSQARVYFFFNSTLAQNTSVWVKYTFCVSSKLSCRYTIDTRVFTAHLRFSGKKQLCYTPCLYIFRFSRSWCETVAEWLTHFTSICLRRLGSILVLNMEVNVENTSAVVSSINSNWNIA